MLAGISDRLVSAVDGGLSRRSAAKHFGVAPSTAIKWVDRWHRTGEVGPQPQGGDQRSRQIEFHAGEILALIEEMPDITLGELADHLDEVHGPSKRRHAGRGTPGARPIVRLPGEAALLGRLDLLLERSEGAQAPAQLVGHFQRLAPVADHPRGDQHQKFDSGARGFRSS